MKNIRLMESIFWISFVSMVSLIILESDYNIYIGGFLIVYMTFITTTLDKMGDK